MAAPSASPVTRAKKRTKRAHALWPILVSQMAFHSLCAAEMPLWHSNTSRIGRLFLYLLVLLHSSRAYGPHVDRNVQRRWLCLHIYSACLNLNCGTRGEIVLDSRVLIACISLDTSLCIGFVDNGHRAPSSTHALEYARLVDCFVVLPGRA